MLIALVVCYAAVMMWFASTGLGQPRALNAASAASDGASVTIDLNDVQPINGQLNVTVDLLPGDQLLDAATASLTGDTTIVVKAGATPARQSWPRGTTPTHFPATFDLTGDVTHWPFDHYQTGPITVELFAANSTVPLDLPVRFVDRLRGWQVIAAGPAGTTGRDAPRELTVHRSPATAAFAATMVIVLVLFGVLAVFVASQVLRRRRRFQPAFMSWYAGMVFASISLRNALPDAPPIGWWIDVAVVLWVVLALAASMAVLVFCWWRDGDGV